MVQQKPPEVCKYKHEHTLILTMQKKKRKHGRKSVRKYSYTYGEFLTLLPCCRESHQQNLLDQLSTAGRPAFLLGKEVPENLNAITYGQLDDLARAAASDDPAAMCISIIMGIDIKDIHSLDVWEVFGFVNFCRKELERINALFESIKPNFTSKEIAAGVKSLKFGTFGVADWYARRMGIANQDEVFSVAWVRIYTCMKNDNMQNNYERRLRDEFLKESKRK